MADLQEVAVRFNGMQRTVNFVLDIWFTLVPLLLMVILTAATNWDCLRPHAPAWWVLDHPQVFNAVFSLILAHNAGLLLAIILVWRSPWERRDRLKVIGLLLVFSVVAQPLWRWILLPVQDCPSSRGVALGQFERKTWQMAGPLIGGLALIYLIARIGNLSGRELYFRQQFSSCCPSG